MLSLLFTLEDSLVYSFSPSSSNVAQEARRGEKIYITFHYEKSYLFSAYKFIQAYLKSISQFYYCFDLGVFNTVLFQVAS